MNESGDESGEGKDRMLVSLFEQCLGSVRRLGAYAQEAQRDGSFDLAAFLRRAQAEARRWPDSASRADEMKTDAPAPGEDQIVTGDAPPASPSHNEIAQRALSIYQRDGGDEKENWERAERELIASQQETAKREPDPRAPGDD